MIVNTIHDSSTYLQDRQEGLNMLKDKAFKRLLRDLIHEHGVYDHHGLFVDVDEFSTAEKRVLLGYYESPEWFEYACESERNTAALFDEHKPHLQSLADHEAWNVYCEAMEERGARMYRHPNNDEVYWG